MLSSFLKSGLPVALLMLSCAASPGATAPKVHHPAQQKTFGGDRPVTIDVPSSYNNDVPTPLIVLLHGYSAGGYVQKIYFGLDLLVEEAGVIVAAPDGTIDSSGNRFWNATDACCNFDNATVDDVAYVAGLIKDISAEWNVDPKRVYVIGHSNGGYMSYRMACDHPELIAGIMSLAGNTWLDSTKCRPSEAVSVLDIQGDADTTVLMEGTDTYPGARQSVAMWANYDRCTGTLAATGSNVDIEFVLGGSETAIEQTTSCPAGIDVELWTIKGGGHLPQINDDFRARVWAWLSAHPKP